MPHEQRPKTPREKAPHEMVGQGASDRDVDAATSRNHGLRSMDYNAGKAALQPQSSNSTPESRRRELMVASAESMRSEYLRYWIPSAHRYARMQMADEQKEQERAGLVADPVQAVPGTNIPDVNRWRFVLHHLSRAQETMAEGDLQTGLELYKEAMDKTLTEVHRWGGGATSLDPEVSSSRVKRDMAFAATAAVAEVVVPPVVGADLLDPGGFDGATGGGSVAAGAGVGGTLTELLATEEVDWSQLGDSTWVGLKEGMIEGGFAVLSDTPTFDELATLSPSQLALQTGSSLRQAAATAISGGGHEATIEALLSMSEEALAYAMSADFRAKWSRDPAAAFAEFRTTMESKGESSFEGGGATGYRGGSLSDLELQLLVQGKAARLLATELTYGGYKTLEAYLRAVCKEALTALSPATIKGIIALCQARLQSGEALSAEELLLEIQGLDLEGTYDGTTEEADAAAVDISKALSELERSE